MHASVRELKAQLSRLLKQVQAGATVTVRSHDKPVAQLVPIRKKSSISALTSEPGIAWNGKKPGGVARPESLPADVSLADWVSEDRR